MIFSRVLNSSLENVNDKVICLKREIFTYAVKNKVLDLN